MVGIRGRAGDLVNHGRLGPKGLFASWQGVSHQDRLRRPLIRENGKLVECDWDTAMNRITERSKSLLQERGPLSHGFYTSGQLFLEEYYALAVIGKAGIGTPHMDGNTRLCTATAAAAMKESFGADGQPGSYTDIDGCDAIFLYGHNMAETQTVLWTRVLDRIAGPDRPKVVCVDPRDTEVARHADVHLAVRPGTNVALMNALVREILANGWVDTDYVQAHTVGLDQLKAAVEPWTAEAAAAVCDVAAADIREAARIFGTSPACCPRSCRAFTSQRRPRPLPARSTTSTCYAGCSATRVRHPADERPADRAEHPRVRRGRRPARLPELGEPGAYPGTCRAVERRSPGIPHWAPPTHAMQIFRYAEQGSIDFLWISATNPAVSMPDLPRIREILAKPDLFLVVQDLFLTETAQAADVVLPAAAWGEKTGTFTNVDRTVHLSEKAVEPPGEARSDLDIFLDYARRMDFSTRTAHRSSTGPAPRRL